MDERLERLEWRMFVQRVITIGLLIFAVLAVIRDVYLEGHLNRADKQIDNMREEVAVTTNATAVLGTRMSAVEEVIRTSPALRR